jgi:hypothetical protein
MKNTVSNGKRFLCVAGCLSLAITLFQVIITLSPAWSLYFGAPAEIVNNRGLLLVSGEIAAVFFGIFGLYGLSGAGCIRRLFLLRLGLIVISAIYILRGFVIVPELLIVWKILPSSGAMTPQGLVSSLISLAIGLIYAIGTLGAWRELKPVKDQ